MYNESVIKKIFHLLLVFLAINKVKSQNCVAPTAFPTQFSCDFNAVTWPLATSAPVLTTSPTTLTVFGINSALASRSFSNFAALTPTPGEVIILELQCSGSGSGLLYLVKDSFEDSTYFNVLRIKGCKIVDTPVSTFAGISPLYSLQISEGSFLNMNENFFGDLVIEYDQNIKGSGSVNVSSQVPFGSTVHVKTFNAITGVKYLSLSGMGISALEAGQLSSLKDLRTVDISYNELTTLNKASFEGTLVHQIFAEHNRWMCECGSGMMEFLDWATEEEVFVIADFACDNTDTNFRQYVDTQCRKKPVGFWVHPYWFGTEEIIVWVVMAIMILLTIIAAILLCLACRKRGKQIASAKGKEHVKPITKVRKQANKVAKLHRELKAGWG